MPVDFTSPEGASSSKTESSMFAPTPLWERDAHKRRRSDRFAARRSDPAMDAGEAGAGAGVIGATTAAEPADTAYETRPADLKLHDVRGGVAAGAVGAGVVVAVALAGVGWYAGQRRDHGILELTPGAPATSEIALNSAPPSATPRPTGPPPAPAETTTTHTRSRAPAESRPAADKPVGRAPTPRVRPAEQTSALRAGVEASATAPVIDTPPPSPNASPMQATPSNPVVNPPNPAPPPSTATPPAGGAIDGSGAPAANRPQDPSATP